MSRGTAGASSRRFLDALDLTEIAGDDALLRSFEAMPQYVPWPKAYGGDAVAQALVAATRTIGDDRAAHSLHAYFLRPVDVGVPIRFDVELTRDGRSFSVRRVTGSQNGAACFSASLSFAVPSGGDDDFALPAPEGRPAARDVPSAAATLAGRGSAAAEYWASGRSFDIRHAESPLYDAADPSRSTRQAVWVRAFEHLAPAVATHPATLAYVCDYTILEPALRLRGLHWRSPGLMTASLDHAMWFHRPLDVNRWFLYEHEAVSVQDDRALVRGAFYQDGQLAATVTQEGLLRAPRHPDPASEEKERSA